MSSVIHMVRVLSCARACVGRTRIWSNINYNDGVQTEPVIFFDCYQLITSFAVCRSCQFVSKPATSGMISEETKNDNIQKLIENAESQSGPPTVVAGEKASQMI